MSVDSVITSLQDAEVSVSNHDISRATIQLTEAVQKLTESGSEILRAVSAADFESPVFQIVKRITVLLPLDTIQNLNGELVTSERLALPKTTEPHDIITSVQVLFDEENDAETNEETNTASSLQRIKFLLSLLTGQQTMREAIFSPDGLYQTAAGSAAPYLTGFLNLTGDEFETAETKANDMLFGPAKRLAELFYSLLTSSFTAGLLLLLIRRLIPIRRPSKTATAVNAAVLTATNIPVLIAGLRAVAKELATLKEISTRG